MLSSIKGENKVGFFMKDDSVSADRLFNRRETKEVLKNNIFFADKDSPLANAFYEVACVGIIEQMGVLYKVSNSRNIYSFCTRLPIQSYDLDFERLIEKIPPILVGESINLFDSIKLVGSYIRDTKKKRLFLVFMLRSYTGLPIFASDSNSTYFTGIVDEDVRSEVEEAVMRRVRFLSAASDS